MERLNIETKEGMIAYLETAYGNTKECICADELTDVLQNIVRLGGSTSVLPKITLTAGTDNVLIVSTDSGYSISVVDPQTEVVEFVLQQSDWDNNDTNSPQYILNKPKLPGSLVQSVSALYSNDGQSVSFFRGNHSTITGVFSKVSYFTLPVADGSRAGLLSSEMYTRINNLILTGSNYTHPAYTPKSLELYKVSVDSIGHVNNAEPISKQELQVKVGYASDTAPGILRAADYNKLFPVQQTVNPTSTNPISSRAVYEALSRAFDNYQESSRGVKFHELPDITTPSTLYAVGDLGRVCATEVTLDAQLTDVSLFDSYQHIKLSEVKEDIANSEDKTTVKLAGWNITLRNGEYNPEFKLYLYYTKYYGMGYYFLHVSPITHTAELARDKFMASYMFMSGLVLEEPSNNNRIVGDYFSQSIMELFSSPICQLEIFPKYTFLDTALSVNNIILDVEPWAEGNWGTAELDGYSDNYKDALRTDIGVLPNTLEYMSEVVITTECKYYIYGGQRWERICTGNCNQSSTDMGEVTLLQQTVSELTQQINQLKMVTNKVIDYAAETPIASMKDLENITLQDVWKHATGSDSQEDVTLYRNQDLVALKFEGF